MLPTLEDRLAIQLLLYRYADAADRRDAAAFGPASPVARWKVRGRASR